MRNPVLVLAGCLLLCGASSGLAQTPQSPPPGSPPPPTGTTSAPKPAAPRRDPAPARLSVTMFVTNLEGKVLPEVWVKATGPVDREGATDPEGSVVFRNMPAGTYRVRFEHDDYVTLEREVTVAPGRPLRVATALNAAPPPPPPPPAKVDPPPQAQAAPSGPPAQQTIMSIPDFIERNYVGREPQLTSSLACMPGGQTTLVQVREPMVDRSHAESDETLYVVAGNGTLRMAGRETPLSAGTFVVVPRGTMHTISRRGSNPIIILSTLVPAPCK